MPNSLPDGTLLTKVCPGYWISSLIEYSFEESVSLPQAHPHQLLLPVIGYWIHHGGQVSCTPNSSTYIGRGCTPTKSCLPWMPATLVHCGKTLPYYPRGSPTHLLPVPLDVGQVWHVQTSGPLLGSPGITFFIVFMLHPSTPGAVPTIDVYSWTLEAIQMARGVTISLFQRPSCTTHTHATSPNSLQNTTPPGPPAQLCNLLVSNLPGGSPICPEKPSHLQHHQNAHALGQGGHPQVTRNIRRGMGE